MTMKILSVFNNKGGVGKTTLTYHLSHALSELGHRVLMIDADPQCNLTIYSVPEDKIHDIWEVEDPFIDEGRRHGSPLKINIQTPAQTVHRHSLIYAAHP